MPVPETDAGGRGENPETDGRTLVKETRQNDPVTSGEGVPRKEAAENSHKRLFSKKHRYLRKRELTYRC